MRSTQFFLCLYPLPSAVCGWFKDPSTPSSGSIYKCPRSLGSADGGGGERAAEGLGFGGSAVAVELLRWCVMQEDESRAIAARQALRAQLGLQKAAEQPIPRIIFAGWLTKRPRNASFYSQPRRRFFVLTRDALEWFKPGEDIKYAPHGRLLLEGVRVECAHEAELVLQSPDGCKLALVGDLLDEWDAAIRGALQSLSVGCSCARRRTLSGVAKRAVAEASVAAGQATTSILDRAEQVADQASARHNALHMTWTCTCTCGICTYTLPTPSRPGICCEDGQANPTRTAIFERRHQDSQAHKGRRREAASKWLAEPGRSYWRARPRVGRHDGMARLQA